MDTAPVVPVFRLNAAGRGQFLNDGFLSHALPFIVTSEFVGFSTGVLAVQGPIYAYASRDC